MANRFQYEITAKDSSAKGIADAKRRMGTLDKMAIKSGQVSQKSEQAKREAARRTAGALEEARSAASGLVRLAPGLGVYTSALGGVYRGGVSAASGLRAAAAEGGGLASGLSGLAAAGGGAVTMVAALAVGAFKLASGWAEGTAQMSRLSRSLGYTLEDMQKLQAAGEHFGIDRQATAQGLGGFSTTVNDALYGRNQDAANLLRAYNVKITRNQDGSVNYTDVLKQVADSVSRVKNPLGQQRAADILGAGPLLQLLRLGGAGMQARMNDVAKYAGVGVNADGPTAERLQDKAVSARQLLDRAGMVSGREAAVRGEGALDTTIATGRSAADAIADGRPQRMVSGFVSQAQAGVTALAGASRGAAGSVAGFGGAVHDAAGVLRRAALIGEQKTGVPALLTVAQANLESGGLRRMPPGSNNPFGIKARNGEPFVEAWTHETDAQGITHRVRARFKKFDSLEEAVEAHDQLLAQGRPYRSAREKMSDPYAYAAAISPHYATDRNYSEKLQREMHRVDIRVYDGRTVATVHSPSGKQTAVAVGRAMSDH